MHKAEPRVMTITKAFWIGAALCTLWQCVPQGYAAPSLTPAQRIGQAFAAEDQRMVLVALCELDSGISYDQNTFRRLYWCA